MTEKSKQAVDARTVKTVLAELQALGSEENRLGMARFGIETEKAFGVPMAVLRPFAKRIGKSRTLALELWHSGYHEARLLAILVIPPKDLSIDIVDDWLSDVNSWDLCDQLTNLFAKTKGSENQVALYAQDEREFVRRAAFALIAWRSLPSKKTLDAELTGYFPLIEQYASDERNFVWKAIHWALRQIGKRSSALHGPALELGQKLAASDNPTQRKVGRETIRELTSAKVLQKMNKSAAD